MAAGTFSTVTGCEIVAMFMLGVPPINSVDYVFVCVLSWQPFPGVDICPHPIRRKSRVKTAVASRKFFVGQGKERSEPAMAKIKQFGSAFVAGRTRSRCRRRGAVRS